MMNDDIRTDYFNLKFESEKDKNSIFVFVSEWEIKWINWEYIVEEGQSIYWASGVAHHLDSLRWIDNVTDHQIETVRVVRYVLHLLQALVRLNYSGFCFLISIVVLFFERSDIGAKFDGVVWEFVLE